MPQDSERYEFVTSIVQAAEKKIVRPEFWRLVPEAPGLLSFLKETGLVQVPRPPMPPNAYAFDWVAHVDNGSFSAQPGEQLAIVPFCRPDAALCRTYQSMMNVSVAAYHQIFHTIHFVMDVGETEAGWIVALLHELGHAQRAKKLGTYRTPLTEYGRKNREEEVEMMDISRRCWLALGGSRYSDAIDEQLDSFGEALCRPQDMSWPLTIPSGVLEGFLGKTANPGLQVARALDFSTNVCFAAIDKWLPADKRMDAKCEYEMWLMEKVSTYVSSSRK